LIALTRLIPLLIMMGPHKSTPVRGEALWIDILLRGIDAICGYSTVGLEWKQIMHRWQVARAKLRPCRGQYFNCMFASNPWGPMYKSSKCICSKIMFTILPLDGREYNRTPSFIWSIKVAQSTTHTYKSNSINKWVKQF